MREPVSAYGRLHLNSRAYMFKITYKNALAQVYDCIKYYVLSIINH